MNNFVINISIFYNLLFCMVTLHTIYYFISSLIKLYSSFSYKYEHYFSIGTLTFESSLDYSSRYFFFFLNEFDCRWYDSMDLFRFLLEYRVTCTIFFFSYFSDTKMTKSMVKQIKNLRTTNSKMNNNSRIQP